MAKDGLRKDNYLSWIDNEIEFDSFLVNVYANLVVGTPAYDLSKKGRNFVDYYGYNDVNDYPVIYNDLFASITDFETYDTMEKLKNGLLNHTLLSFQNIPDVVFECIHMYIGEASKNKFYKECLPNLGRTNNEVEIKRKIAIVERFFYHIRNCFAHGSYMVKKQNDERFFILQDDDKAFITARMIIKESTLEHIMVYLENRRNRNEQTNS